MNKGWSVYYGLRGWPCTRRRSAPWVWFWYFFGWHNWITLFIVTSKLWPQWPRRSLEVIWGCLVINSCLPFFKVLDYFLFVFMGIIGNWLLYGLRGWPCTRRRSALWVWLWYFFGWYNWDAHFSATSKLLTSMTSEVVWGHLRPFCQKLLFDIF